VWDPLEGTELRMRTVINIIKILFEIVKGYFSYIRTKSITKKSSVMAAKELTEVVVALGKVAASTAISLKDKKFSPGEDLQNYMDDIVPIINAITDIDKVGEELPLDDETRDAVVQAGANTLVADLNLDPTSEDLEAAKDVAVGILAIVTLAWKEKEIDPANIA